MLNNFVSCQIQSIIPSVDYQQNQPNHNHNQSSSISHKSTTPTNNFVLTKKNLDGEALFQKFKSRDVSRIDRDRQKKKRLLFDRKDRLQQQPTECSDSNVRLASSNGGGMSQMMKGFVIERRLKIHNIKNYPQEFKKFAEMKNQRSSAENMSMNMVVVSRSFAKNSVQSAHQQYRKKVNHLNIDEFKAKRCNLGQKFLMDSKSDTKTLKPNSKEVSYQKKAVVKNRTTKYMSHQKQQEKVKRNTLSLFFPVNSIQQQQQQQQDLNFNLKKATTPKQTPQSLFQQLGPHLDTFCTSKAISVMLNNQIIYNKNGSIRREVASLTKIMTCITVLFLCEKYEIPLQKSSFKVSRQAANLGGTTSNLKYGDYLSVKDLLYGMMLPSGNDAAQTLADNFGRVLCKSSTGQVTSSSSSTTYTSILSSSVNLKQSCVSVQQQKSSAPNGKTVDLNMAGSAIMGVCNNTHHQHQSRFSTTTNASYCGGVRNQNFELIPHQISNARFIQQMNGIAQFLNLNNTRFNNAHGLSDLRNKSTANDFAKLVYICMKNSSKFAEIVNTQEYEAKIYNKNTKMWRLEKWVNSNLGLGSVFANKESSLFQKQIIGKCMGVKTGNTPNAGPCLASFFRVPTEFEPRQKESQTQITSDDVTVILLCSKTKELRFQEAQKIYRQIVKLKQL